MFMGSGSLPKAVKWLLIINIAVYIIFALTGLHNSSIIWFGLTPSLVLHHFQVWRLITYLFIHAGPWHIILNMFALWMFGPQIEWRMGIRRFLFYYFFTGIGGGVFSLIFGHFTIGASTSIFGLLVAFAIMFPNNIITLIFPPISMKAKHFVIGFGIFQFIMLLGGANGIAWEAHIGGMLFGYFYFHYDFIRRWNISAKLRSIKQNQARQRRYARNQFIEEQINPILDKISKVGIKGLSRKERQMLKKSRFPK